MAWMPVALACTAAASPRPMRCVRMPQASKSAASTSPVGSAPDDQHLGVRAGPATSAGHQTGDGPPGKRDSVHAANRAAAVVPRGHLKDYAGTTYHRQQALLLGSGSQLCPGA